jgi:hypothetical protein
VADKRYKTRRGELLAELEHTVLAPGYWYVEGFDVDRAGDGWHVTGWHANATKSALFYEASSFEEALEYIKTAKSDQSTRQV